jgi:hypothetical protein
MKAFEHKFYLHHDKGVTPVKISTGSTDRETARTVLANMENAPVSAIKDTKKK